VGCVKECWSKDINYIKYTYKMTLDTKEYIKQYMKLNLHKYLVNTDCPCGGVFNSIHKARHLRSKKHIRFITRGDNLESQKCNECVVYK